MATMKVQPISGVSSNVETQITTVHPSICAEGLGRWIGWVLNSVPVRICGVTLSNLIAPLFIPLAVPGYFITKILGNRYVLTNRSVQIWKSLGNQIVTQVDLNDIGEIVVEQGPGQVFYKAADLVLLDAKGGPIARLKGVPRADVFRQNIIEARDARREVEASLKTIQAR